MTTPWSPNIDDSSLRQDKFEGFIANESINEIVQQPALRIVKRLSCFEEICPSEPDEGDAQ